MKNVYKVCLLGLAMLPWTLGLGAQPKDDGKEKSQDFWKKAKAEKVEFIKKKMNLPKAEWSAFLKVYNESEEQKGKLFHERQEALLALKKSLDSKEKTDVATLLQDYLDARARLEAWENSDYERFSAVLTDEQFACLMVAEESFRREQIHRLDGRGGGPGAPPRGGNGPGGGNGPRGATPPGGFRN